MVPPKNQNVLQVLSWPNINKVHAFSWPLVSMNKSEFKYKSWAVPLTWKCMLFHGHWAASVSSQYHHPGWQVDLSQQAGGFILLSTQLHFNLNARLEEGPLSPDLWNGDICGRVTRITPEWKWKFGSPHYLQSYHYQPPGSALTKLLTQTCAHSASVPVSWPDKLHSTAHFGKILTPSTGLIFCNNGSHIWNLFNLRFTTGLIRTIC